MGRVMVVHSVATKILYADHAGTVIPGKPERHTMPGVKFNSKVAGSEFSLQFRASALE